MRVLDVARGAYVRLPAPTRAYAGRLLQCVPTRMRFGATYRGWRGTIARARTDAAFAGEARRAALDRVLDTAARHAPHYARSLAPFLAAVRGSAMDDPSAWARVPILSRQTVLDNERAMCTVPPERLDRASTDGSSGQPLSFLLDRDRSPIEYAFIHDAWSRAGFSGEDWRCVFRGFDRVASRKGHMEVEPALRELRLSVFHLDEGSMAVYAEAMRSRRIRFIHGYPSAITLFAESLIRTGAAPFRQIRGIFPISEKLYPHQRETIERAFGHPAIVPFYGMSEKVAFAVERAGEPDLYDFDPLYGFTELVDEEGVPVTRPGDRGRIVSTGLLFRGMPLIRYDTRDVAELVEGATPRNGHRLSVRRLLPRRSTDYIVGRSGRLIPMSGFCVPVGDDGLCGEVQFFQDTPGSVELLVAGGDGSERRYRDYVARMRQRTGGDLSLTLKPVERLPMTGRGKRKFLDQRLPMPAG